MGMKIKGEFNFDGILDKIVSKVEENPEFITDNNVGKEFKFNCPVCEDAKVATFLEGGKCKCNDCGNEFKLNFDVNLV